MYNRRVRVEGEEMRRIVREEGREEKVEEGWTSDKRAEDEGRRGGRERSREGKQELG